ncbi:MAG: hypothetical protein ACRDM0_09865 [Thermoleophilaceae bacterium]
MAISRQVAEAVQSRAGPVRNDTLGGRSLPGRDIGRELEPGRTEGEVIWSRCSREVVHTLSHSLQD